MLLVSVFHEGGRIEIEVDLPWWIHALANMVGKLFLKQSVDTSVVT